jgi:hypothetical protein
MTRGTILQHIQPSVDFAKVIDRHYVRLGSRAGPPPSIGGADVLLDERRELTEWISEPVPA